MLQYAIIMFQTQGNLLTHVIIGNLCVNFFKFYFFINFFFTYRALSKTTIIILFAQSIWEASVRWMSLKQSIVIAGIKYSIDNLPNRPFVQSFLLIGFWNIFQLNTVYYAQTLDIIKNIYSQTKQRNIVYIFLVKGYLKRD